MLDLHVEKIMAKFDRILVPTAFSALSKRACEWAVPLAQRFGSEIHVAHIVPVSQLAVPGGDSGLAVGMGLPIPGPSKHELLERAQTDLDAFVGEVLKDVSSQVRTFTAIGSIRDELVRYAEERTIDVIVMGTHADGMLKRLVFGSIGKSVLETAPCPVLLVPVKGAPR